MLSDQDGECDKHRHICTLLLILLAGISDFIFVNRANS